MASTRDLLLRGRAPAITADIPELGGTVYLRPISMATALRAESTTDPAAKLPLLLVDTLCDADGNALLTEADIPQLMAQSSVVIGKLLDAVGQLRKATDPAALGESSGATPPSTSSTISPTS